MTKTQQIIVAVFSIIILGLVLVIGFGQNSNIQPISGTSRFFAQVIMNSLDRFTIDGEPRVTPQCSDRLDNDNDGAIDWPDDHSCTDRNDNNEQLDPAQCFDDQDNDGDGLVDMNDPGCVTLQDNNEGNNQCADGQDNDNDGFVDYPADFGCRSTRDNLERNPRCSDGINNDTDNFIDFPADPGCVDPHDDLEVHGRTDARQCSDNIDNDGDGYIDFDQDAGCSSSADNSESSSIPQCRDGRDNDYDGLPDFPVDSDCSSMDDTTEGVQPPPPTPQCSDDLDNDADGLIDVGEDPGCSSATDNDETNAPPPVYQCSDTIDNDGDGLIDFPADPGCTSATDTDEFNAEPPSNVLRPGGGWGSHQLSASGSGPKAIARWDVVPNQTVSTDLTIGVIAFHKNGINRVEFYADRGVAVVATEMTENPDTGVWEYNAVVSPSTFPASGQTEIRAIVYPNSGTPRILQDSSGNDLGEKSLRLTINKNNSLTNNTIYVSTSGNDNNDGQSESSRMQTIAGAINRLRQLPNQCSGARIKLSAGTYMMSGFGTDEICEASRWLTIEPANGVSQNQVNIVPNPNHQPYTGRNIVPNMRFSNVTFRTSSVNYIIPYSPQLSVNRSIWLDNVKIEGTGFFHAAASNRSSILTDGPWPATYFTDVALNNVAAPEFGGASTILMRDIKATNIGSDFSNNKRLTVNVEVDHLKSRHDLGSHPDFIQTVATPVENMIVYNAKGTDIGAQTAIGGTTFSNVALVNVLISKHVGDEQVGMWMPGGTEGTTNHLLLWNISLPDSVFVLNNEGQQNVDFRGNYLEKMMRCLRSNDSGCGLMSNTSINQSGWTGGNNHFRDTTSYLAITYGTPINTGGSASSFFRDHLNYDFHLSSGSDLANRIANLFVPADVESRARSVSTAVGPYRGTNEGSNPAAVNKRPVVNIGADFPLIQTPVLPYVRQFTSIISDDNRSGSSLSHQWVNMDNRNMSFGSAGSANTSATFPNYGTYPVQLRVSDGQLTGTDEAAVIVVPQVAIVNPANGSWPTGTVNIQISTVAPGVASLKIFVDGVLRNTCNAPALTCSYSWNTSGLRDGHSVTAEASDGASPANIGRVTHYLNFPD